MKYPDKTPGNTRLVVVEWDDITDDVDAPGLLTRWTPGWMLDEHYDENGIECIVLGQTWDELDWADFCTIPKKLVRSYEYQRPDSD